MLTLVSRLRHRLIGHPAAPTFALSAAATFLIVRPAVGDLCAARVRASAAWPADVLDGLRPRVGRRAGPHAPGWPTIGSRWCPERHQLQALAGRQRGRLRRPRQANPGPGPEDRLVRPGDLPYLRLVWSDSHWRLDRVESPAPIAAPPGRVTDAEQASFTLHTPRAARIPAAGPLVAVLARPRRLDRAAGPAVRRWHRLDHPATARVSLHRPSHHVARAD